MKTLRCKGPKGLPILEISDEGDIAERISPGVIREADYFELFRKVKKGNAEVLVACPRGAAKGGKCKEPLVLLRVAHPRGKLKSLKRDCADGSLSRRRSKDIDRVIDVIRSEDLKGMLESPGFAGILGLVALVSLGVTLLFRGGK